ncbi:MAG: hypothetical protein ACKV22_08205 [Bryobacteraceae bacterium]
MIPELPWTLIYTVTILALTLWFMRRRFTQPTEWNFPLFYYLLLVLYVRGMEGLFVNEVIFAAAIGAMFIRFEFLGKIPLRVIRTYEFFVLVYVVVKCFGVLF